MRTRIFLLTIFFVANIQGMLFEAFPLLRAKIPHICLGKWPTSVKKLEALSNYLQANIYHKDEGDCGVPDENGFLQFGGNKVRKLEFLLADALAKGHKSVLTYGGYASNHMVATACYAKKLGLKAIGLLFKQHPPATISRNLLLNLYYGAHIFICPQPKQLTPEEIPVFLKEHDFDEDTYVIPIGGSSILGVLAQAGAILELKQQIEDGLLPEPDYIYVPFGSMGTTAGLLLGIKLAGLKTKVKAIKVTRGAHYTPETLCDLILRANEYLHDLDENIPLFEWRPEEVEINTESLGEGYAYATKEGQNAQALFKDLENITLDQTYTAKAAAAMIADCNNHQLHADAVILFWNTYCAYEYPELQNYVDTARVPEWMVEYL